ncbi:MAG: RNA-binding S4 domain-containing protein [Ichthyobacteriaceae bacterium]|nr:RNA-binding S4 domain-containing protein [Ichthyobacteriaceae bacterium]
MGNFKFELKEEEYVEMIKLFKIFKLVGSGGEAKVRIDNGDAIRNGHVEYRKRAKIKAGEKIEFDGNLIEVV